LLFLILCLRFFLSHAGFPRLCDPDPFVIRCVVFVILLQFSEAPRDDSFFEHPFPFSPAVRASFLNIFLALAVSRNAERYKRFPFSY